MKSTLSAQEIASLPRGVTPEAVAKYLPALPLSLQLDALEAEVAALSAKPAAPKATLSRAEQRLASEFEAVGVTVSAASIERHRGRLSAKDAPPAKPGEPIPKAVQEALTAGVKALCERHSVSMEAMANHVMSLAQTDVHDLPGGQGRTGSPI